MLNKRIEIELQERGIAVSSIVSIKGKKYLHAAITNHRSRRDDLQALVREVMRLGNELA
jgi:aromatic-L-amino-acid decarboxylase